MEDNVTLLSGVRSPENTPWEPFAPQTLAFLTALSKNIRSSPAGRREELAAFGFWCRRAHLEALKQRHESALPRLGRGLVFHLAPSNVPTVFAYSCVIGLLAGNANIVRISQRRGELEELLCEVLRQTLEQPEFAAVKARVSIVSYGHNDQITADYLSRCDARVLWGGDETVAAMRRIPMPSRAVEVCFPDRWSLALFSQTHLSRISQQDMEDLAHRFYNDTYSMDQNACSSPQLLLWLADGGDAGVRRRWWETLSAEAERRYPLTAFQAARKYERLCEACMPETGASLRLERYGGNLLWVARLTQLPPQPKSLKGGFGLFFEGALTDMAQLLPLLSPKVQTLVCEGLDCEETASFLAAHRAMGVDRVVPAGQALELDTVWDGQDLIAALSRVIA